MASEVQRALLLAGAPSGEVVASVERAPAGEGVWGAMPAGASVEAGSVTKCITGLLLSLADAAGEVTPDDELGRFLDVGAAGRVTLASLATHTSGLPRLPARFTLRALRHPRDPYRGYTEERLLSETRRTPVAPPG